MSGLVGDVRGRRQWWWREFSLLTADGQRYRGMGRGGCGLLYRACKGRARRALVWSHLGSVGLSRTGRGSLAVSHGCWMQVSRANEAMTNGRAKREAQQQTRSRS